MIDNDKLDRLQARLNRIHYGDDKPRSLLPLSLDKGTRSNGWRSLSPRAVERESIVAVLRIDRDCCKFRNNRGTCELLQGKLTVVVDTRRGEFVQGNDTTYPRIEYWSIPCNENHPHCARQSIINRLCENGITELYDGRGYVFPSAGNGEVKPRTRSNAYLDALPTDKERQRMERLLRLVFTGMDFSDAENVKVIDFPFTTVLGQLDDLSVKLIGLAADKFTDWTGDGGLLETFIDAQPKDKSNRKYWDGCKGRLYTLRNGDLPPPSFDSGVMRRTSEVEIAKPQRQEIDPQSALGKVAQMFANAGM